MKKQKYLFLAAIAIVAMIAVIFFGCEKDKTDSTTQLNKTETLELSSRIEEFQMMQELVDSGNKTDDVMSVEEMRQILDIMVNYEHSRHMISCERNVLDTLYVTMPRVDQDGNVKATDVVATYESLVLELVKHIEMAQDGRNIPSYFSIVMPVGNRGEWCIKVVFLRGAEKRETKNNRSICDDEGPFLDGEDYWYWGDSLGKCKYDPVTCTSDAAQQLSEEFEFVIPAGHQGESYYIWNVVHAIYRPCSIPIPDINSDYYVDPDMEDCADTWLFYYVSSNNDDLCIFWDELNCYWRSINRNIVAPSAPLHYYPGPTPVINIPYHCCHINSYGFNDANYYYKVHAAHVIYCCIDWYETPDPPLN